MELEDYIIKKTTTSTGIPTEITERWNARVLMQGLQKLGGAGAKTYLAQFGRGISEQKCVHLAIKAEQEGYSEMALEFWHKAYSLFQASSDTQGSKRQKINVLFLAANPADTTRLMLDKEIRSIDLALQKSEFGKKIELNQHWAVRVTDIQGYLLRHKPSIVHFSGHGNINSEIILENDLGQSTSVSVKALSQLFYLLKDNIRCVVLNACYSKTQAEAIAEHIEYVVGMSQAIGDSAAISFSTSFYQAIGYGKDIKTAFDLGCLQINLENLNQENTPILLSCKNT